MKLYYCVVLIIDVESHSLVGDYCSRGWPVKEAIEPEIKPYILDSQEL